MKVSQLKVLLAVCVAGLLCLTSCREEPSGPGVALREALEALNRADYDAYLQCVDFGVDMDSARTASMRSVLKQHLAWRQQERPAVADIRVVDTRMQGDTVCFVYYQYVFADSTREVAVQKMVQDGDRWKLRLRN